MNDDDDDDALVDTPQTLPIGLERRIDDGTNTRNHAARKALNGTTLAASFEAAAAAAAAAEDDSTHPSPKRRRLNEAFARRARAEGIMKRVRAQHRRAAAATGYGNGAAPGDGGSDDEEHFSKREAARLQRDIAKLNPITLGVRETATPATTTAQPTTTSTAVTDARAGLPTTTTTTTTTATTHTPHIRIKQSVYVKAPKGAPKTTAPCIEEATHTSVIDAVSATDFDDLAGMDDVIRQLREMVLLPLQYPQLFAHLQVAPPRGILFHGVPGTGKTLAARALAGACARLSPLPITFFARKGADCLGKFVGEAERTLRLMFEEACRRAPSIIFLDELDALVPARAHHSGSQDQIHASVVSTLLSLMDGMADRGNVVIVAATNRPEDIDSALRRPGRFDREVYFGLPTVQQRTAILTAQTRKWGAPPSEGLLSKMAAATEGFAGADLGALCTAAVMSAVRRTVPHLQETIVETRVETTVVRNTNTTTINTTILNEENEENVENQERGTPVVLNNNNNTPSVRIFPDVVVEVLDWEAALEAAPPPCSRRSAAHSLGADAARPLSYPCVPLLLRPLREVLVALGRTSMPLPPAVTEAVETAVSQSGDDDEDDGGGDEDGALEAMLISLGAVQQGSSSSPPPLAIQSINTSIKTTTTTTSFNSAAAVHPVFRILLSGKGEQHGQDQIAGSLLRLFGSSHVSVISLPVIAAEGGGDAAAGVISITQSALSRHRSSSQTPVVLYLPRIEAWGVVQASAVETTTAAATEVEKTDFSSSSAAAAAASFSGIPSLSLRGNSHHTTINTTEKIPFSIESDAWIAFESSLKEVDPHRPLLVIATTSTPLKHLPAGLLSGFDASGGVVQVQCNSRKGEDVFSEEEALEEAVKRASDVATAAVARHASSAFIDRITQLQAQQKPSSSGVEPALDQQKTMDTMKKVSKTNGVEKHKTFNIEKYSSLIHAKMNTADWERAQQLYASVQRFIMEVGARLMKDRRCRGAGTLILNSSGTIATQSDVSLYSVAVDAASGRFLSLEALQGAVHRVVQQISVAEQQEKRHSEVILLHHINAAAYSHAIEDEVGVACHTLRAALEVDDDVVLGKLLADVTQVAEDVAVQMQHDVEDMVVAAAVEEVQEEVVMVVGEEEEEEEEGDDAVEKEEEREGMVVVDLKEQQIEDEEEERVICSTEEKEKEKVEEGDAAAAAAVQVHSELLNRIKFKTAAMDFVVNAKARGFPVLQAIDETVPMLTGRGMAACRAAVDGIHTYDGRSDDEIGGLAALQSRYVDAILRGLQ